MKTRHLLPWAVPALLLAACTPKEQPVASGGEEIPPVVAQAPSGLSLISATTASLTFSWSGAADVAVYSWTLSRDGTQVSYGNTGETSVTVPGLTCRTTYLFSVRSVGTTLSEYVSLEGTTQDLAAPGGLALARADKTALIFSWEAASEASAYDWTLSRDGSSVTAGRTEQTQVQVEDLDCSATYLFSVRSIGAGESEAVSVEGMTASLDAPVNLTVTKTDGQALALSWEAGEDLSAGFDWTLEGQDGTAVASGIETGTDLSLTGLTPGTAYRFSVRNVRGEARSEAAVLDAPTLNTVYVIETSLGSMTILLYDDTPRHRDNFMELADRGYYSGIKCDRVLSNLAQFGYTEGSGSAHWNQWGALNYTIPGEVGRKHHRGTLSQAQWSTERTSPMSFYLSRTDTGCTYLDPTFTVYGEIVDSEGLETLDRLFTASRTGETPDEDIVILSVRHP